MKELFYYFILILFAVIVYYIALGDRDGYHE